MESDGKQNAPTQCNNSAKTADMNGMSYDELSYGGMNVPGAINDTDAQEKVKALAQKHVK